jgi:predicted nucleotidyltransferase
MSLDLRPDHLAIVRTILAQQVPKHTAWAFGSRVKGSARPFSDLDIGLEGTQALGFEQKANLKLAFSESNLPFAVDVVELATCSSAFAQAIANERALLSPH